MTIPSFEGCPWNVKFPYSELRIIKSEINLRERTGTLKSIEEVINHRVVILILDYVFFELMVVDTYFDRIIFLAYEKN